MVALVLAVIAGNTVIALIAVAIAIAGLVLLSRDWLKDRGTRETGEAADRESDERGGQESTAAHDRDLKPEMFEPDVSYEEAVESADDIEDFDLEGNSDGET